MNRREFNIKLATLTSMLSGCSSHEDVVPASCEALLNFDQIDNAKLIINNDGLDAFGSYSASSIDEFIKLRIDPILSHADYLFYCTGTSHIFSHKTNIGERFNNNLLKSMDKINTDPLQIAINHTHSKNKKIYFSLRMNDTHDYIYDNNYPVWKKINNEAIMGSKGMNFKYGGNRWSAMNYEKEVTLKYIIGIVDEILSNYNVDGIELDFFRHPIYFTNQLVGKPIYLPEIDLMTHLFKEIVFICKSKNKGLAIRVPDSIKYNKLIGIDLMKWLEFDAIDILTLGGYFHLSKWCSLSDLKNYGDFKMFACLSRSRLNDEGKTLEDYFWSNEAIYALSSGFDGIYLFNVTQKIKHLYSILNLEFLKSNYDPNFEEVKGDYESYWVKNGNSMYNY